MVLQKEVDEFFRDQRKIGLDAVLVVDAFQLLLHEGEDFTVVVDAPQQRLAAMPNESDLLTLMDFQIVFGLKDDLLGKSKAEGCLMGFGFVAQIAVFATEITGVSGLEDDDHVSNCYLPLLNSHQGVELFLMIALLETSPLQYGVWYMFDKTNELLRFDSFLPQKQQ